MMYYSGVGSSVTIQQSYPGTVSGTIANGASLSSVYDLGTGTLCAIQMDPSGWTAAGLSFSVSIDGTNYYQLNNNLTGEYTVPAATVASAVTIQVPPSDFLGFRYIKVRSGTYSSPVNQGATRTITLAYRP